MDMTVTLAFIAGLVSFISPCVLPLVPAYVGYMGGRMTNSVARATASGSVQRAEYGWSQRFFTLTHSLFFIAGFTFVFVAIGLLSTAFVSVIGGANISTLTDLIGRIGGIVIIFFGLHFMGVLPSWLAQFRSNESLVSNPMTGVVFALAGTALLMWGFSGNVFFWNSNLWDFAFWSPVIGLIATSALLLWLLLSGAFTSSAVFWHGTIDRVNNALYADTRRDMQASLREGKGFGSSALMGVVFSAGWTPCIGPVFGAVLTMAAGGGDVGQAGSLLTAYSLGLGVPFVLTALAIDSAQVILRKLQRHMHKIELASGAFLILIGVLVASGQLQSLSQRFAGEFAEFSITIEEGVIEALTGADLSLGASETLDAASEADSASDAPNDSEESVPVNTGNAPTGLEVGNLAPDFETVSDTGKVTRLSDHRGDVVLLNFWATWCGPCRIEMPGFEAMFSELQAEGFSVIAVNNSEMLEDILGFREELDLSFTLALDEHGDIQDQYGVRSYPSTTILDRKGTILAKHFGVLTVRQIHELVNDALAA